MKTLRLLVCLLVLTLLPGCKSRMGPPPPMPDPGPPQPSVSFQGDVRNQVVPWTEGLKLSQALDAAQYTGRTEPMSIYIFSQGKKTYVSPRRLLSGTDDPVLYPGDSILIVR